MENWRAIKDIPSTVQIDELLFRYLKKDYRKIFLILIALISYLPFTEMIDEVKAIDMPT